MSIVMEAQAEVVICEIEEDLSECLLKDVDALIMTDEFLNGLPAETLPDGLGRPELVELPVLLVAPGGPDTQVASTAMDHFLNLFLLNRPIHMLTFKNALKLALRVRATE